MPIPDHLPTTCPANDYSAGDDAPAPCGFTLIYREPVSADEPLTAVCSRRPTGNVHDDPHEWIVVGEPGREALAIDGPDGQPVFPIAQSCPLCAAALAYERRDVPDALLRATCAGHGGHRWLVDDAAGTMEPAPGEPHDAGPGRTAGAAALELAAGELRELLVAIDRALEQLAVLEREHPSPDVSMAAGELRSVAQVALGQDLLAVQLLAVMLENLAARQDAGARVADQRREQSYVIVLADLERRRQGPSPGDVSALAAGALEAVQRLIVEVRSHAGVPGPRCGSRRRVTGDQSVAVCDRSDGHGGTHKGEHPAGRVSWTDADALPPAGSAADEVTS